MLTIVHPAGRETTLRAAPAREALLSWNTSAAQGALELRVLRGDGTTSGWLPYVTFSPEERRSHNGRDAIARIEIDIVRAQAEIDAVVVRADVALDALALSVPFPAESVDSPPVRAIAPLAVPALSQYLPEHPRERGWCSPTSMAMLLGYWGIPLSVVEAARAAYDAEYGGTGNWAFSVALAGRYGLRGVLAHLRGLAHAARLLAAGIPLALSYAWKDDSLPGAPLEHSAGHLAVLRGFDERGDPMLNDPAHPAIAVTYDRVAFERVWRARGTIAYLVVPSAREAELLDLVNAP